MLSKNTQNRLFFGLILVLLVTGLVLLGQEASLIFVGIVGALLFDEITIQFFKRNRSDKTYLGGLALYSACFLGIHFIELFDAVGVLFNRFSLALNIWLALYLLLPQFVSWLGFAVRFLYKNLYLLGFLCFLVINPIALSLNSALNSMNWMESIIGLILVVYITDIGAWFFGKNFGRHKLWERVSPKKTVEGAVGGMISSAAISSAYWGIILGKFMTHWIPSFFVLSGFAQVGDLIQSKIKRQFKLKDSSNLIPGHGGIFDRVDSLLFVAPFYWELFVKG